MEGDGSDGVETPLEVLSESECWRLLRTVDVGRIAMATDDCSVDIFPINFVVDHGTIVFRTAAGTKLTRAAKASEVAFEADDSDLDGDGAAWSVVVRGVAETIEGRTELFDAFITTKPQGLGVGLSICHTIIESHGGRLSVETRVGDGAQFRFTLPAFAEDHRQ